MNELTRRKSNRLPKPSSKVLESKDTVVRKMFRMANVVKTNNNIANCEQNKLVVMATHYGNMKSLFDSTINECHNVIFNAALLQMMCIH